MFPELYSVARIEIITKYCYFNHLGINRRLRYKGCFVDKRKRDLKDKRMKRKNMTIGKCARFCKGFKYMGVQVFITCYLTKHI